MKTFVLLEDIALNFGTIKKGTKMFEKRDSLGRILYPESGNYPVWGKDIIKLLKLKRIDDVPYSVEYYVRKNQIKKLKAQNKAEELKK